jgi:phosphoglycolate phosphatase-like HAD superfamily hydrolase
MKKYIIFDLDGTLIKSNNRQKNIIFDFFKENQPEYYDILRYSIDFKKNPNLKEIFVQVYWKFWEKEKKIHDKLYKYLDEENKKSIFIKWTIPKILELKNKYQLYLSTRSSTKLAKEILKKNWIDKYFEVILWGDEIPKWEEHLDFFKENSGDENFFSRAFSIWDWLCDKIFAHSKGVEFIKIWDKYKSISDIKEI